MHISHQFAFLNNKQVGFQSRKLSTDAVLYFLEKIIGNLEDNNNTGAVLLDLAKTFNSISHEIFLEKAKSFNLSQSAILLFKSFFTNRPQCVKFLIDSSDKMTINHGVQQGTLLVPLIFVLYVNNYSQKLEGENDVVQFAVDTIICNFELNENIPQKIGKILEQTDNYLTENKLTLNADKAEMIFLTNHTNLDPEFSFKGKVIKPAHDCRYLGVQIDSKLTFEN